MSTAGDCTTAFPCALGALAPGATRTIVVAYQVPAGYTAPAPVVNTAVVTTTTADPTPTNNSSTATTPLVVNGDLRLTKTGPADGDCRADGDLHARRDQRRTMRRDRASVADPTPASLAFVSNTGDCAVAFPCALGTLVPGATRTITATYQVPPGYTAPATIVNTATVTATSSDVNPANNTASATTALGPPSADLAIMKAAPATVVPGNTITYTITITNSGISSAAAVSVADPTPVGPGIRVEHRRVHDGVPVRARGHGARRDPRHPRRRSRCRPTTSSRIPSSTLPP